MKVNFWKILKNFDYIKAILIFKVLCLCAFIENIMLNLRYKNYYLVSTRSRGCCCKSLVCQGLQLDGAKNNQVSNANGEYVVSIKKQMKSILSLMDGDVND
ncbi:hypothetical protein Mgra_00003345 [Meloidogyne graminicola]|uniref:Uncharacterized protein n=1 Tax=Meloidogyne graminicola TaxID=189291 RepID=A0A8S9ZVM1_9BILA|nr:hypothetical protein Mgra_00003345 [Meloidogyne graminicola]